MRGLNLLNTGSATGYDTWFVNRVYTPDAYGFRPFAGVKLEYDSRKSVFENGPNLTAVRHDARSDFDVSGHGGIRFEQEVFDDINGVIEGVLETNKTRTVFAGFSYAFDSTASVMLKYALQEKESVVNNIIGAQIRIQF
jgi:hypothetical protein